MACRLISAKQLPGPMMRLCQLDPREQNSEKFKSKYESFHKANAFEYVSSAKYRPVFNQYLTLFYKRILRWYNDINC